MRKLRMGTPSVSGTVHDRLTVSWLYDTICSPDGAIGRPEETQNRIVTTRSSQ